MSFGGRMELHVTLIAPGAGRRLRGSEELVASLPDGAAGGELAALIEERYGVMGITVEGVPLNSLVAGRPPLTNGALLLGGQANSRATAEGAERLLLAVRSGPGAGLLIPLERGLHRLGRCEGNALDVPGIVGLPDPELSRRHAELHVTDTLVRLVDCGSSNGTWLGDRRVRDIVLEAGQEFRMGGNVCSLEFEGEAVIDPRAGSLHGEPLRVTRRTPAQRTTTMLALGLAPLAMGLGLALFFGQWMFLAFSSMSLLSLAFPLAEGRRERRSFKRELAAAVEQDLERRTAAAPDAAQLCLASRGASAAGRRFLRDYDGPILIRLGTADLPADVTVDPPLDSSPPRHRRAPLVLALKGMVRLDGRDAEIEGTARFLLVQLAVLPAAQQLRVHLIGGSDRLRLAARFLPSVSVARDGDLEALAASSAQAGEGRDVTITMPGTPPSTARVMAEALRRGGGCVVDGVGALGSHDAVIQVGESSGHLVSGILRSEFTPDLLGHVPFERVAREWALRRSCASAGNPAGGPLPDSCSLDVLVPTTRAELVKTWSERKKGRGCWLPLGVAETGRLGIDLVADSPHVLVAGTTGSGKSELLRTMIAGGAALQSPDELTFLLVDFKGGAGLAPLKSLPHCVGVVTDLSGGLRRVLVSLRAEVVRREQLLAEVGCEDLSAYAGSNPAEPLPRLAIVVDEFRVLVEEEPDSLRELLRIASVGRSLGVHLIMATQRPHGAISGDIRANVGCAIALRVSGAAESRDVIGSDLAARVPTALPGRGYLALGGDEPIEFQTACLSLALDPSLAAASLESAAEWLRGSSRTQPQSEKPDSSMSHLVRTVREAWASLGDRPPRRPVADPLPADAGPAPRPGRHVSLGIADLPHEQRLTTLRWAPEERGHLAIIGGSPGAGPILANVASQLADGLRVRHLYILDADNTLPHLEHHERTGAYACPDDLGHAARIISRLAEAASKQRPTAAIGRERSSLILIASGWGRWISAFRNSPHAQAEGELFDLVRADRSSGPVVLIAGEGDLVASRIFSELRCRLFLPHGMPDDARLGWPRLSSGPGGRMRGIATGLLECEEPVLVECFTGPSPVRPASWASGPSTPALRILPLPVSVMATEMAETARERSGPEPQAQGKQRRLAIGLHGDRGDPLSVALGPGEILLALGRPGAGKTAFLEALPSMNPAVGPWFSGRNTQQALTDAIRSARAGEGPLLLLDNADGMGALEDQAIRLALEEGVSVIATAGYGTSIAGRLPPALRAQAIGTATGIAIGPRSPADGDLFGVRLEPLEQFVPGRAIAVVRGHQAEVQLGWLGAAASGQSLLNDRDRPNGRPLLSGRRSRERAAA
ncbi:FtsK/SpoIIIE domain-containing protein [Sinomonas terrae]|uniref:FHA domain-containing protein n=1 Tax=Sinomonas terrae TaxID=2908838 RepID=A0ABS9TYY7_9MICC|nr:FtsK/SpoIIIE domain-containing protein [Sinomonas terrae]MCH6469654.1 FHA domain-containing protein [Sinomonas terrae]